MHPEQFQRLLVRVQARNAVNMLANILHPKIANIFSSRYAGEKVMNKGGGLIAKIEAKIEELRQEMVNLHGPRFCMWLAQSDYNIRFCISYSVESGNRRANEEASFNVAKLNNGLLGEIYPIVPMRTDYDANEVARLRQVAEEMEEKAREANNACHPFGRFER